MRRLLWWALAGRGTLLKRLEAHRPSGRLLGEGAGEAGERLKQSFVPGPLLRGDAGVTLTPGRQLAPGSGTV
jgi:hypothetical protein